MSMGDLGHSPPPVPTSMVTMAAPRDEGGEEVLVALVSVVSQIA